MTTPSSGWTPSRPGREDGFGLERMRDLLARARRPAGARTRPFTSWARTASRPRRSRSSSCSSPTGSPSARRSRRTSRAGASGSASTAPRPTSRPPSARPARGRAARRDAVRDRHRCRARRVRGRAVDAAVVEAGLGGRLDATNVLRTRVVLLTNVGLEHTDVLGDTVEEIAAREARRRPPRPASSSFPTTPIAHLVPGREIVIGGAREAAEAFVGHAIDSRSRASSSRAASSNATARSGTVRTIPTVSGTSSSDFVAQSHEVDYTLVVSILADKDADAMLRELRRSGPVSSQPPPRPSGRFRPGELAERARASSSTSRRRGSAARPRARPRARGARARDRVALSARRPRREARRSRGNGVRHGESRGARRGARVRRRRRRGDRRRAVRARLLVGKLLL